ncbi:MAG: ATP-binding cassette domain-containing protein [Litorimonas sp.]
MTSNNPAISVKNVTMAYGSYVVQEGLNFDINKGEIFIIMGDSGSGKSTLLKNMIGLNQPSKGAITFGGRSLWSGDEEERLALMRSFGVLYQSGALWSSMTVAENVALPLKTYTQYSDSDIADIVAFKLSLVGLSGFEGFYPSEISGGMKKRAGLARAMSLDPDILFFDEPSAGLDPISSHRLDELILELRDSLGTTIVVVTHELASLFSIGDRAVFVDADAKTQTALGTLKDLVESPPTQKISEFLNRGATKQHKGAEV